MYCLAAGPATLTSRAFSSPSYCGSGRAGAARHSIREFTSPIAEARNLTSFGADAQDATRKHISPGRRCRWALQPGCNYPKLQPCTGSGSGLTIKKVRHWHGNTTFHAFVFGPPCLLRGGPPLTRGLYSLPVIFGSPPPRSRKATLRRNLFSLAGDRLVARAGSLPLRRPATSLRSVTAPLAST